MAKIISVSFEEQKIVITKTITKIYKPDLRRVAPNGVA